MDGAVEFLEAVRANDLAAGRVRGLFHVLIGRRISRADGTVLSTGLTWRQLAAVLKAVRFDKELVRELGADPDLLAPRDREKMWYSAVGLARPHGPEAVAEAESLAAAVKPLGFVVGPPPPGSQQPPRPSKNPDKPAGKGDGKSKKK